MQSLAERRPSPLFKPYKIKEMEAFHQRQQTTMYVKVVHSIT